MANTNSSNIVIDTGSYLCKAGFAGEDMPRVSFQSTVGRPRHANISFKTDLKEVYVGEEAQKKRDVLSLKYPIEHGVITNWDDIYPLWHHTFNELSVKPEEHSVLLTEVCLNPKVNRERITQFNVNALYVADRTVLLLLASNSTTGTVLDCGAGVTYSVPIYEGNVIRHAIRHSFLAGRGLTDYIWDFLLENSYNIKKADVPCEIKQKLSYVSLDFEEELKKSNANKDLERSFKLPNGEMIKINKMRFECPEALFKPSLVQMDCPGIHELVHNSISNCDVDIRDKLYSNVVLSSGTTMFPGFGDRLKKELSTLAPSNTKVYVSSMQNQKCSNWIGGSIFASRPDFENMCVSKLDYEEYGPSIVHLKCF